MNKIKIYLIVILILAAVLRFVNLASNPPSLYWDEVSLGYNAYSILKTGFDEHHEWMPLTRFIAFGDYKPPGYIYATVPSIFLFGLSEFAVRFPSALFGTLSVLATFFFVKELLRKTFFDYASHIALLSSFLLAISPWHIQLSRGAFEGNLAMFFNLCAVALFVYAARKIWLLPFSVVFFVLSFYTFNSNRVIAPLLGFVLVFFYANHLWRNKKWALISFTLGIILIFPNFSYLQTRESKLRFQEVSIFTNLKLLETSNTRIAVDNHSVLSRILHNRRVVFAREFLIHYLDNFKGEFLFVKGDRNPRLSIQEMGEMYLIEFPFLFIGLYLLLAKRNREAGILLAWLLIAPIPAGVARETPHALRIVSMLPVPQIVVALGLWYSWFLLKRGRKLFISLYSVLLLGSIFYYLHTYYVHYPIVWSGEWQYGYKEMVEKVTKIQDEYDHVVVTNALGRPYIYFLFYQQRDPAFYWTTRRADRDWAGLWTVDGFEKYAFDLKHTQNVKGKTLVVAKPSEMPKEARVFDEVKQRNGETIFQLGEL